MVYPCYCIINEFRSILEKIVEFDWRYLVHKWLIKGLELTNKMIDKKYNYAIDKLDNKK